MMGKTATKKLQVRFTDDGYNQVRMLSEKAGAKNTAEMIRSAIALFEIYIEHDNDGWEMQFIKDKKIKTLIPMKYKYE